MRDPLQRAYWISRSLQDLDPENLPELVRVLESQNMGIEQEELRLIMVAWARFDGPGAYAWAKKGLKSWRKTLTAEALYAWAFYDALAVMNILDKMAEDPERVGPLRQLAIEAWLRSDDKQGVSDYIANFPDIRRRGRLYFLLAGEIMMTEGADGAMRWVEAVPDDAPNNLKLGLFDHVSIMVARRDPVAAAEWFLAHRTQPYSEKALTGIVRRWVQYHDPQAAFQWLLGMSTDGIRDGEYDSAIAGGFRKWIQLEHEPAREWLLGQLPNPTLDPAVYEAVRRTLPLDPEESMNWARRLDDQKQRNEQTIRVGIRWRSKDPEALNSWLKENDLPEQTLKRILAKAPQPRQAAGTPLKSKQAPAGKP